MKKSHYNSLQTVLKILGWQKNVLCYPMVGLFWLLKHVNSMLLNWFPRPETPIDFHLLFNNTLIHEIWCYYNYPICPILSPGACIRGRGYRIDWCPCSCILDCLDLRDGLTDFLDILHGIGTVCELDACLFNYFDNFKSGRLVTILITQSWHCWLYM